MFLPQCFLICPLVLYEDICDVNINYRLDGVLDGGHQNKALYGRSR